MKINASPIYNTFQQSTVATKSNNMSSVAFKASPQSTTINVSEGFLEKFVGKFGASKMMRGIADWSTVSKKTIAENNGAVISEKTKTNFDKLKKHFPVISSVFLSSLYLVNTAQSKAIEKDRKPALMVNMALVCALSSICGYLVNGLVNKALDVFKMRVEVSEIPKKFKGDKKAAFAGLSLALSIVVFQTMYRYIGPVLVTPLANKITGSGKKDSKKTDKQEGQKNEPSNNSNAKTASAQATDLDNLKKDDKKVATTNLLEIYGSNKNKV